MRAFVGGITRNDRFLASRPHPNPPPDGEGTEGPADFRQQRVIISMKSDELREKYLAFFESKGCVRRPSDVLVPAGRPLRAVHPRRHEPVQGPLPGPVQAGLHPGDDLPEVPADRRHRQRGPHALPPHVLRDAGQFQLRRLLQTRGHPLGLGVPDRQAVAGPGPRAAVGHDLPGRRRGGGDLAPRDRSAAGTSAAAGRRRELLAGQRPQPRARRRLRTVQRNLRPHALRPGRGVEPRVHAVQPRGAPARQPPPAAEEEHRHGHGLGAHGLGAARRGDELPHRHPAAAGRGGRRGLRPALRAGKRQRPPPAPHRRSRPRLHAGHPRERASGQQEAGLRHPPPAAPRRFGRPPDGRPRAASCTNWSAWWPG